MTKNLKLSLLSLLLSVIAVALLTAYYLVTRHDAETWQPDKKPVIFSENERSRQE